MAPTSSIQRGNVRWDRVQDIHFLNLLPLPAAEFVGRWCLHILPKGFTKTRSYGGWSNHHRDRYVAERRALRHQARPSGCEAQRLPEAGPPDTDTEFPLGPPCPHCGSALERVERVHRTSWRDIFQGTSCPAWYTFRRDPG